MTDFLFWVIGTCFLVGGLFLLFVAFLTFLMWRKDEKEVPFKKFLLWLCAGVAAEGLMVVFYTFKP
ncbi:hypothetical protein [Streptomyces sp. GbtcB6]|uniref:hypothetical protein n=1 Tax=Streptomyces sp. GbtcB6 TaxID=2824751 RepID=UPI001C2F246A|nr:hypothetical protein [Streptomyces sp. GbtcB6]